MAYTEFSTADADYLLQLGSHFKQNTHHVFEGIDALVIETGANIPCHSILSALQTHPQMSLPVTYCRENNIPLYMTDNACTKLAFARQILGMFFQGPLLPIISSYSNSDKKMNDLWERIYADYDFILQNPLSQGRDALNARKIEEFVVPQLRERSGKVHPKIALVFGSMHIGLKYHLKSKQRRDATLWNWRNLNFGKYAGFNKKELNKVWEAGYDGNWKLYEYRTSLFP